MKIIQKISNGETDKIDEKVIETQVTIVIAIAIVILDILNLLIFLFIID